MIDTVVLSKKDSTRRKTFNRIAASRGLNYRYFDAIEHNELRNHINRNILDSRIQENPAFYTFPKLSCALSHRLILQEAKNTICVLEDDAIITKRLISTLRKIEKIDLTQKPAVIFLSIYSHSKKKIRLNPNKKEAFLFDIENIEDCASAMGYVVTKPLLNLIQAQPLRIFGCADEWSWLTRLGATGHCVRKINLYAYHHDSEIDYKLQKKATKKILKLALKPISILLHYLRQNKKHRDSFIFRDE